MKELPLTHEQFAVVDDDVFDVVKCFKWNTNNRGYAGAWIDGRQILLHRFIMNAKQGEEFDHIDGNKLDCRRENLRLCTHSQNIANDGARKDNKLGIKGVDRVKATGKYRATIRVNYKKIHIGNFPTAKEAASAWNEASKKYFGDFAYQNNLEVISC